MVDGQGIAHPRRLGIAAHLGVLLDIPAIGVAKSKLTGQYKEPKLTKGSWSELTDKGARIDAVQRSKDKVKPLFISPRTEDRTGKGGRVGVTVLNQISLA